MTERGRFEEWFTKFYYTSDPIAKATIWAAWQASRNAAIDECAEFARNFYHDDCPLVRCHHLTAEGIKALKGVR